MKKPKIILISSITLILLGVTFVSSNNIQTNYFKNYNIDKDLSIIVGPFPQNPDKNSITISWETSEKTQNNKVNYGENPDCDKTAFENNSLEIDFHKVRLSGLSNSKKYYYKVNSDGIESNIYSFYTMSETNDTIKFIAYGDNRGEWDNWNNASIVATAIEKENPFFVLNTGDLVHNGTVLEQWYNFFNISNFIHNSTLFPVLGNHEIYGSYYFKYFILPNNEKWYSIDTGPVKIIGLDSNDLGFFRPLQIIWLIKELMTNENPFTIIFFHHPLYSSGNHGSFVGLRFLWGPFFQLYKVDMVINGHDHSYERGKVLNINYIVTGGGGGPLYDIGESWWTVYSESVYHYCLIEVDNNTFSFQAKKPDGTIIDSLIIEK